MVAPLVKLLEIHEIQLQYYHNSQVIYLSYILFVWNRARGIGQRGVCTRAERRYSSLAD